MIGKDHVRLLDVGVTTLGDNSKKTPWIATNHPDVTSYNCCTGDPSRRCGDSFQLIADEEIDFVAACWITTEAKDHAPSIEDAKRQCAT